MNTTVIRISCGVAMAILLIASAYFRVSAQTTCSKGQFIAKYYRGETFSNAPVITKCERSIENDWGESGPGTRIDSGKADGPATAKSVGNDHFSVRWEGDFNFEPGVYTFVARADDGIRVYVGGQLIINEWRIQGVKEFKAKRTMTGGTYHVKVEYFENVGGAEARVRWFK